MTRPPSQSCTAFGGTTRLARGPLPEVALAVKRALDAGAEGPVVIFDDASGRAFDIDTRGSDDEILARLAAKPTETAEAPRGRGRPRLGVVAREVTLLPRHWAWLNAQPGGASVALRKLVEQARRSEPARRARAHEAAYRFLSIMAGDLPGFEEATRALFADDRARFEVQSGAWPADVRDHALWLGFAAGDSDTQTQ